MPSNTTRRYQIKGGQMIESDPDQKSTVENMNRWIIRFINLE
jgi:hypothetical protein